MVRPTHLPGGKPGTFYDSTKHEFWAWSERAGKYYWSKWAGVDLAGKDVRLPQYNWGSAAFQEEAEKIVRFWMDTGIDGMIIDAVNWYVDHTWALGRRRMTDVIASYDNSYSQPEGAGGFREDPVAWITEGGWNSVQDYGLGIWWESESDVIAQRHRDRRSAADRARAARLPRPRRRRRRHAVSIRAEVRGRAATGVRQPPSWQWSATSSAPTTPTTSHSRPRRRGCSS